MTPLPATRRLPKHLTNWRLGQARLGRFLSEFDKWKRKFRSLRRSLAQAGMAYCVYHRWKHGQVVPKESALRRYCLQTGIDTQYVLTGIPSKVGNNQLTLWHYQEQHKEAATAAARAHAYSRLVVETLIVFQEEFPTIVLDGIITKPEPTAILKYEIDPLYRFEISILPLPDGYVGFEVYRVERGEPAIAVEGWCEEGALLGVKRYLRENIRLYRKRLKQEDVLTPYFKGEYAFYAKHNASYN